MNDILSEAARVTRVVRTGPARSRKRPSDFLPCGHPVSCIVATKYIEGVVHEMYCGCCERDAKESEEASKEKEE